MILFISAIFNNALDQLPLLFATNNKYQKHIQYISSILKTFILTCHVKMKIFVLIRYSSRSISKVYWNFLSHQKLRFITLNNGIDSKLMTSRKVFKDVQYIYHVTHISKVLFNSSDVE